VNEPRRLKRAVIKEELVELTGDFVKAVLLQQMLYWSERVQDFKQFAQEELQRAEKWGPPETLDGKKEFVDDMVYGWVYKTAEELSSETMLNLAANTIRRHLKELVEKGYPLERSNPKYRWDRTLQYRVDLLKVQADLMSRGYPLEGYSVELPIAKMEHGASACGDSASHLRRWRFHPPKWRINRLKWKIKSAKLEQQYQRLLQRIQQRETIVRRKLRTLVRQKSTDM
jgi:hypothetical protein